MKYEVKRICERLISNIDIKDSELKNADKLKKEVGTDKFMIIKKMFALWIDCGGDDFDFDIYQYHKSIS